MGLTTTTTIFPSPDAARHSGAGGGGAGRATKERGGRRFRIRGSRTEPPCPPPPQPCSLGRAKSPRRHHRKGTRLSIGRRSARDQSGALAPVGRSKESRCQLGEAGPKLDHTHTGSKLGGKKKKRGGSAPVRIATRTATGSSAAAAAAAGGGPHVRHSLRRFFFATIAQFSIPLVELVECFFSSSSLRFFSFPSSSRLPTVRRVCV